MQWPRTMPALITPFDAHGDLDLNAHRHNVAAVAEAGAEGVLIAGSTGEGPYLDPSERKSLVAAAREVFPGGIVVCGIAAETDRRATTMILEAVRGRADAVLIVTPGTMVRGRERPITEFYRRLAEVSPLPILLYSVPPVTGYELPISAVRELSSHHNIVGMKDSGGDTSRLDQLSDTISESFVVYAGASRALYESGVRGAHGAITASANYAWDLADAAIGGNTAAQTELSTVAAVVERYGVPGTKFAASLVGLQPSRSRLPLLSLDPEAEQEIREAVTGKE